MSETDPQGPTPDWNAYYNHEAALHDFNPERDRVEILRCFAALSVFPKDSANASLLDAGCGNGFFCHWISSRHGLSDITGVDISEPRTELARKRYPRLKFVTGDLSRLPFNEAQCDIVTCIEVLEHMRDPLSVIRELVRVARKYILITVPDRQPVRMILCPHCNKSFAQYGHIQSFDRTRLEELLREAGAVPEKTNLYFAQRGAQWGIPFWLGRLITMALRMLRPSRATFLAVRARVRPPSA
jgi:SAM-dependent methyltransferase